MSVLLEACLHAMWFTRGMSHSAAWAMQDWSDRSHAACAVPHTDLVRHQLLRHFRGQGVPATLAERKRPLVPHGRRSGGARSCMRGVWGKRGRMRGTCLCLPACTATRCTDWHLHVTLTRLAGRRGSGPCCHCQAAHAHRQVISICPPLLLVMLCCVAADPRRMIGAWRCFLTML